MYVCSKLLQLCPTLYDPMDHSPPGSSDHGILHARILELAAVPSSRGSSQPRDQTLVSCIAGSFFTVWTTREACKWKGNWKKRRHMYMLDIHICVFIFSAGKEYACNVGDLGLIPGLGRSPWEGKGYPLQHSGLENSMGLQRPGHDWATFTSHGPISYPKLLVRGASEQTQFSS